MVIIMMMNTIDFIYFYFLFSEKLGICSFEKIFDLSQGIRFINKNFNKNKKFTKAALEMAISLVSKLEKNAMPVCQAVMDRYTKLID